MDNSNLLDLFKISDYITFDKYLRTDTRNSISSSYSLTESEALKHIKYGINTKDVLTKTLFSEASKYLDDIISGLRYQDGHYDLIRLKDEVYQEKLDVQSAYWEQLKEEIAVVRQKGYD